MISTTPEGQAPIRKPHTLDNKQPNAKADVKRRWRASSEYIAIMKSAPGRQIPLSHSFNPAFSLDPRLAPCPEYAKLPSSDFQSPSALLASNASFASPRIHQINARPASGSAHQRPKNWFSSNPAATAHGRLFGQFQNVAV